jgi:hypothetical protein
LSTRCSSTEDIHTAEATLGSQASECIHQSAIADTTIDSVLGSSSSAGYWCRNAPSIEDIQQKTEDLRIPGYVTHRDSCVNVPLEASIDSNIVVMNPPILQRTVTDNTAEGKTTRSGRRWNKISSHRRGVTWHEGTLVATQQGSLDLQPSESYGDNHLGSDIAMQEMQCDQPTPKSKRPFRSLIDDLETFGTPESIDGTSEHKERNEDAWLRHHGQPAMSSHGRRIQRSATHTGSSLGSSGEHSLTCAQDGDFNATFNTAMAHTPHCNATMSSSCGSTIPLGDDMDDFAPSSLGSQEIHDNIEQLAELDQITQKEDDLQSEELRDDLEEESLMLKLRSIQRGTLRRRNSVKLMEVQKAKLALEQGGGPEFWGISVEQLCGFCQEIKEELRCYCKDHRYEHDSFGHVCLIPDCQHDHGCAEHRQLHANEDHTLLSPLQPNMHIVTELFIKPRTKCHSGMRGLALTLNAEHPKKVEKFVSHTWNGRFEDFVDTLSRNLLPQTSVFICSFALPQNLDVGPILDADLERTPFAMAHNVASEVWLIVDNSIDVIDRVWCIYELFLSLKRKKHVSMGLTAEGAGFQAKIMDKVGSLDVRRTKASRDTDLQAITAAIAGMEDRLNGEIITMLKEKVHQQQHYAHRALSNKRPTLSQRATSL